MTPHDPSRPHRTDEPGRRADGPEVLDRIRADFVRHALLDHATITVHVDGGAVTLTGTVGSRAEQDEAGRVAAATPGVRSVRNQLTTVPHHPHERFRS